MYVCQKNGLPFTINKNPIHVRINLPWKHTDPSWVFFSVGELTPGPPTMIRGMIQVDVIHRFSPFPEDHGAWPGLSLGMTQSDRGPWKNVGLGKDWKVWLCDAELMVNWWWMVMNNGFCSELLLMNSVFFFLIVINSISLCFLIADLPKIIEAYGTNHYKWRF